MFKLYQNLLCPFSCSYFQLIKNSSSNYKGYLYQGIAYSKKLKFKQSESLFIKAKKLCKDEDGFEKIQIEFDLNRDFQNRYLETPYKDNCIDIDEESLSSGEEKKDEEEPPDKQKVLYYNDDFE